ncbi:hypothetical protein E2C01_012648 [Portunus trituberculatus]|uniref:Uncharacterized protein n=1 Tax=Portunus trituberculatus TaxID=210409 RepID=A0A5B7DE72_PORTR|nr:hypothetical protein [Portunus trituberculatus]
MQAAGESWADVKLARSTPWRRCGAAPDTASITVNPLGFPAVHSMEYLRETPSRYLLRSACLAFWLAGCGAVLTSALCCVK